MPFFVGLHHGEGTPFQIWFGQLNALRKKTGRKEQSKQKNKWLVHKAIFLGGEAIGLAQRHRIPSLRFHYLSRSACVLWGNRCNLQPEQEKQLRHQ